MARDYCAGPVIPARFAGRCIACDEHIDEDDKIRMVDEGAIHADCHDCDCGHCT